ncbi:MAG: PEP-utilizing enzyme, partial [Actinomycetota bacterium]|nr:PEP-utilizing enzyme [Actinomycetota bacterium]
MNAAEGILTARGGMTSHAAVVARGWGKTCVSGCSELVVDEENRWLSLGGVKLHEGDWVSLNGTTGEVIRGQVELAPPAISGDLDQFMTWVDEFRRLKVLANADTPEDAKTARDNGAEGIGLVRTEHMFFGTGERIMAVRRMIMAADTPTREAALNDLLPFQREDFEGIFRAMDGCPVTIRLLDPPLHEFLPDVEHLVLKQAHGGLTAEESELLKAARLWQEQNPMIGTRGVRLGYLKPGLYAMQVTALLEAVAERVAMGGTPIVEVMIPLTVTAPELAGARKWVTDVLEAEGTMGADVTVGTMIETPRVALRAHEIAEHADFFSFGTNDLTQLTFGFSRDDVEGRIMSLYLDQGLLDGNPFDSIDVDGVGELVKLGADRGREAKPGLKLGVCGEHGGDLASIKVFYDAGVDYVSCSPYRVPIARLAAAQGVIAAEELS